MPEPRHFRSHIDYLEWYRSYRLRNREKLLAYHRKYRKENRTPIVKLRDRARQKVSYALKSGLLIKSPCEFCGTFKSQAHHDDYFKPLEVKWLCRTHHNQQHR